MKYVLNAISLSMVPGRVNIRKREISIEDMKKELEGGGYEFLIGHENVAIILHRILKMDIYTSKKRIQLFEGDKRMNKKVFEKRLKDAIDQLRNKYDNLVILPFIKKKMKINEKER